MAHLRLMAHGHAHAALQGVLLLCCGPWIDHIVSGNWVGNYIPTPEALLWLMASCLMALGVNVSQFMCLGRFSAVTFLVREPCASLQLGALGWHCRHRCWGT